MDNIVREKNYFLNNLFLKLSGLCCQNKVFSNNFGAVATQLFDEFLTLDDIAARLNDELVDFMIEHGKDLFFDPKATATVLKDAVHKSYRMNASADFIEEDTCLKHTGNEYLGYYFI